MSSRSFRDDLLDFDNDEQLSDKRVKPALLALMDDQSELLDAGDGPEEHDLRGGFPGYREVIEWYQRAVVRTLGHIEESWPPLSCVDDTTLTSALIRDGGMDESISRWYRRVVESVAVQPAFAKAYQDMKPYAKEYVQRPDDDGYSSPGKDLDPASQAYLAMRPGFQVIDSQQHRALTDLWGGFSDVEAIHDWVHGLSAPSNGEIDPELGEAIVTDGVAVGHLISTNDSERSKRYREALAAAVILPAFIEGVRGMETEELAQVSSDTPTTLRMKGGGGGD